MHLTFSVPELPTLSMVLAGAALAGFTTGFAGFGTGLVASGLWLHALPAPLVPPLVAITAVVAQLVGLVGVRRAFDWRRAAPFLVGGALGVPLGVATLGFASPGILRMSIGGFLVAYGAFQLSGLAGGVRVRHSSWQADCAVGVGGGFLGGFAGLSGPLPLIWLQLHGGPADRQRATYQPFNLVVLALASIAMAASGQMSDQVLSLAVLCLPLSLLGAWVGVAAYRRVPEKAFRTFVLALLLASGLVLVVRTVVSP